MSDTLTEYIVTLNKREDLYDFYEDMETPGGNLYIPDRSVGLLNRRNISRNTHYSLTEEEATQIRKDPRVLAVEQVPSALGIEVVRHWDQTGDFEKNNSITSTDKNWGLQRIISGSALDNWGTDGSFTQYTSNIKTTSSGRNVDVVIVDAHINPNHPEFAANPDGSGGSRVNLFDWYSLSSEIGVTTTGSYDYSGISSNHGTHVAGTAAGNTQGWARDANIYNMEFSYTGANALANWELYIFDYLRAFHLNKAINPTTGRRNPTITNHSWGYSYGSIPLSTVIGHNYRGSYTDISTLDDTQKKASLEANGIPVPFSIRDSDGKPFSFTTSPGFTPVLYRMPAQYAALDADIEDAISDGVIVISSAGNSYWNSAPPGDQDYNNTVRVGSTDYTHSRGGSPARGNVIVIGNIGSSTEEYKNNSSNFGPLVDMWAPGTNIVSAVYNSSAATEFSITLADDPRNSSYKIGSISGTSMASPQVCGILACYAEQNPNMPQEEALEYIITHSKKDQINSLGSDYGDYSWLGDNGNNRYLFYNLERLLEGLNIPRQDFKNRPTSGATYPRPRIRRRG